MENRNTISGTKTGKAFQTLGRLSRRPGASTMALPNGGERKTVRAGSYSPAKWVSADLDWLESYLAAAIGLDSPCSLDKNRGGIWGWTMIRS